MNKQGIVILWAVLIILIVLSTVITFNSFKQPVKIIEKVERVEVEVEKEVEKEVVIYEKLQGITFNVTAYCSCEICTGNYSDGITATGTKVKHGRTIAVDPAVIALGSKVIIEGFDTVFTAEDTGNPKYMSGKRIDIYFDDHQEALEFGRKELKIWVIEL
jgi:3D (Asp-Asp-Asp) domain-containing protein